VAIVNVERATSETAFFDGELPLSERQLDRLAEQLERRRAAGKRGDRERRAERSLSRNSVLPGGGACGGC
jgi:hypothetical protein